MSSAVYGTLKILGQNLKEIEHFFNNENREKEIRERLTKIIDKLDNGKPFTEKEKEKLFHEIMEEREKECYYTEDYFPLKELLSGDIDEPERLWIKLISIESDTEKLILKTVSNELLPSDWFEELCKKFEKTEYVMTAARKDFNTRYVATGTAGSHELAII